MACADYLGTYVAAVAQVEVDQKSGSVLVKRVVCAQDMGQVIANAVYDHSGIRLLRLPMTPKRIREHLATAST